MIQTAVDRLMDEMYDIDLICGNILLGIILTRSKKYPPGTVGYTTAPAYTATANMHSGIDIRGTGRVTEEALESLRAGLIGQYAPKYAPDTIGLVLPVEIPWPSGYKQSIGHFYISVPEVLNALADCDCRINAEVSLASHEENLL